MLRKLQDRTSLTVLKYIYKLALVPALCAGLYCPDYTIFQYSYTCNAEQSL